MSSGTLSHIAERKNTNITEWPLGEVSLTVIPAEPRTITNVVIKQLADNDSLKTLLPENWLKQLAQDVTADESAVEVLQDYSNHGDDEMSAELAAKNAEAISRLEQSQSDISDSINLLLDKLENSSVAKNAKHVAPQSETDHADVKSFGDWLLALRYKNTRRLTEVYGTKFEGASNRYQKDIAESALTTGGALVPDEYQATLLQITNQQSSLYNLVRKQAVGSVSGTFPSLDNYTAVSANVGDSPFAGGVTSAYTAEGAALTETQPTFKDLSYRLNKVGGIVEVSSEVIADSPIAIQQMLLNLFGIADANKLDYYILRGTGAGEPEGILNSAAAIGVAPGVGGTFTLADTLSIMDRFMPFGGGNPVWVVPPGMMNEIAQFETSGGGGVFQANIAAGMPNTLYGYPIITNMHMPAPDQDDVLLLDPQSYIMFDDGRGLVVDVSEHVAFNNDKLTWRFKRRCDGKMWLNSAVTPSNGGSTLSSAVYHADA
jgi:HK97 family phage major capsid protein